MKEKNTKSTKRHREQTKPLTIRVANPPTEKQAELMVKKLSEHLQQLYYS